MFQKFITWVMSFFNSPAGQVAPVEEKVQQAEEVATPKAQPARRGRKPKGAKSSQPAVANITQPASKKRGGQKKG